MTNVSVPVMALWKVFPQGKSGKKVSLKTSFTLISTSPSSNRPHFLKCHHGIPIIYGVMEMSLPKFTLSYFKFLVVENNQFSEVTTAKS
jgi:hypothetical protein